MNISEVKKAMWMLNKFCKTFSMYECFDKNLYTYPTSAFIINSMDICKELIKNINYN